MNYDIFISFKHTDDYGNVTEDYFIAKRLYDFLTSHGYVVFFSESSLEEIGSSRYKADIDHALDTARILFVVLSKAEYANTQWVRYEWESFFNDFLSGQRSNIHLFTLINNVHNTDLPRTLRNVQSFLLSDGFEHILNHIKPIIPRLQNHSESDTISQIIPKPSFTVVKGKQVSEADIEQAVYLDTLVYEKQYQVTIEQCLRWFSINPDIYVMLRDDSAKRIIGYVNVAPVTDECYMLIRSGRFLDSEITEDMILSYDMPFPYSVYFTSIVIHPKYQNSRAFFQLYNAVIDNFLSLTAQDVFIKRMIADAVSSHGINFCKLFGMNKVYETVHDSTLYEIQLIPPQFHIISKKTKQLFDVYHDKYYDTPYLFD